MIHPHYQAWYPLVAIKQYTACTFIPLRRFIWVCDLAVYPVGHSVKARESLSLEILFVEHDGSC